MIKHFLALCAVTFCLAGCQVSAPRPQNFSILSLGSPRAEVIANLGQPVASTKDKYQNLTDSMRVMHGRGAAATAAVGGTRWIIGMASVGLSEAVIGKREPEPVSFIVEYDSDNKVKKVTPVNERAKKVLKAFGLNSIDV